MDKSLESLTQSEFNCNVAFKIHLKEFNQNVRDELEKRISEVFFFTRGVDWQFDSFGIEKAGERKSNILGYFIFRATDIEKLKSYFYKSLKIIQMLQKFHVRLQLIKKLMKSFLRLKFS